MVTATPNSIAHTYELSSNTYLLGLLSKGVTVYQQQVRALNLAWALAELNKTGERPLGHVAVIGGGVAGLTFTSAIATAAGVSVSLFERRWDLCPLQQGSDTRWIHPNLYDWPELGSRSPSAGLPVLNWSAARASDVARKLLNGFAARCDANEPEVYLGTGYARIHVDTCQIEWLAHRADRTGRHFRGGSPLGQRKEFSTIVIAAGFGLETDSSKANPEAPASSYWRNDTIAQPVLTGAREVFIISGHGDGGLVDLFRLSIERFRQDTILEDLFETDLDQVSEELRKLLDGRGGRINVNAKSILDDSPSPLKDLLDKAAELLRTRLRKDTRAILHVQAEASHPWNIDRLFGASSSFLNRLLLYLLYQAGGFAVSTDPIEVIMRRHGVSEDHVIRRHGTAAFEHVLQLFAEPSKVVSRLTEMRNLDAQSAEILWTAGYFPQDP